MILKRSGSFKKTLPVLFAIISILYVWLYRNTFKIGFLGEDFSWIKWAKTTSVLGLLQAGNNTYFRPLSVNIPYFLFSLTEIGTLVWKAITLFLYVLSAYLISRPISTKKQTGFGVFLASIWLSNPSLAFSVFYLNAFDYILFPFACLAFFRFAFEEKALPTFLFFALALFSKEQGIGLILAPIVLKKKFPRWYWMGSSALLLVYLWLHAGFRFSSGMVGGFAWSLDPTHCSRTALALLQSLALGTQFNSWGILWHGIAWLILGTSALYLLLLEKQKEILEVGRFLALMFILFIPLCLLKDLRPDYMSAGFWRLIFLRLAGLPSLASRFQEKKIATTCAILTVISCIVAAQNIPAQESFFERESRIFKNLLRSSAPFLENCNHTDRVVIKNLDIALGNTAKAEIAIWAFRSEYLKTRFYLQRPASNPGIQNSIDPYLWVNESQTIGHPVLNIGAKSADEFHVIGGAGIKGCGLR